MAIKILVMGLPGAGKTTLATELTTQIYNTGLTSTWYNADDVRHANNDWDFSEEGRLRQAQRMRDLADAAETDFVICDFVAPLQEMRDTFDANWIVWLDTITKSEYEDTDAVFERPLFSHFIVTEKDSKKWAAEIALTITDVFATSKGHVVV